MNAGFSRASPLRHPSTELVCASHFARLITSVVLVQALIENCDSAFGYDFGHNVIPSLIGSARVYAFDFRDEVKDSPRYWRDIGTIDSYYDASMDLVRPEAPFNPYIEDGWHSRLALPLQTAACVCGRLASRSRCCRTESVSNKTHPLRIRCSCRVCVWVEGPGSAARSLKKGSKFQRIFELAGMPNKIGNTTPLALPASLS